MSQDNNTTTYSWQGEKLFTELLHDSLLKDVVKRNIAENISCTFFKTHIFCYFSNTHGVNIFMTKTLQIYKLFIILDDMPSKG